MTEKQKIQYSSPSRKHQVWLIITSFLLLLVIGFHLWSWHNLQDTVDQATTASTAGQVAQVKIDLNNKQALNVLNELLSDAGQSFKLSEQKGHILVSGQIKMLGQNVNYILFTKPSVTKDGGLVLNAEQLQAGSLPMPTKTVLRYMESKYKSELPDWVSIKPQQKQIVLAVNEAEMPNHMHFQLKSIKIKNNHIKFEGGMS